MTSISALIKTHQETIEKLHELIPQIEKIAAHLIQAAKTHHTIFWMGNGGSAADSQHMAAELISRFQKERRPIASIALTTDTSILTAISNDYDFDLVFSRQLEGLCKSSDVVIGISTSGNSQNVLKGIETAKSKGAITIALTGNNGGKLKPLADECLVIPAHVTARIQEAHTLVAHILCEMVEEAL